MADDRTTMADILKKSGYKLGIFGKNHCFTAAQLARWFDADYSQGSDAWNRSLSPQLTRAMREHQQWIRAQGGGTMPPKAAPFPPGIFSTRLICDRAMQFIDSERLHPFAAWISIPDPHHPVQTPEKYARVMPPEKVGLPPFKPGEMKTKNTRMQIYDYLIRGPELPEHFLREFVSIYYGMTTFIDDELGRLMDLLDRRGLAENTIVLFTSDHGDFDAEHHLIIKNGSMLDSMIRIPMLVSCPGKIREGHVENAPVNHVDIMPTVLSLCGLRVPDSVQGRRLPLRACDARRTFVYSEYGAGGPLYTWEDARAIGPAQRLGDYALNTKVLTAHLERRERAGHLRMIRTNTHKLIVDSNGEREFYDLNKDPYELTNVHGHAAYKVAEVQLAGMLDAGRF
jgi:arylsulfatase A-like enzyme